MGVSKRLIIAGFILFSSWSSFATEHPEDKQSEEQSSYETEPSSECPLLFGDDDAHEESKLLREQALKSIWEYRHCINVVHHTDWEKPQLIYYSGIELVNTELDDESDPIAIFFVSEEEEIKDFGCDPGWYEVHVGDTIGSKASVLAVLPDVVLIVNGDELRYMKVEDADYPNWRMIWASTWKIIRMPESRSSGGRITPKPTRKSRHRPRRNRNRRR